MTETHLKVNNNWTSSLLEVKEKVKVQPKPHYYSFIRCKGQKIDLPVIFKQLLNKKEQNIFAKNA